MTIETIQVKRERTNQKEEVIFSSGPMDLTVKYWWDDHGKLFPWDMDGIKEQSYKDAAVKVIQKTWTEFGMEWSDAFLYINDIKLKGSVYEMHSMSNKQHGGRVDIVVGWG
jgi:hypothetical protein